MFSLLFGQGTWQWTGRVHPELKWSTITTENFNIHYHNGIEDIAKQGASIAEQVRPVLMKQVGLESLPRVDIIFTTEDEIMNGYALWTNMTFIWVDQNDAAIWLEDVKWLHQVLSHELQHIVFFNSIKTWMPEPWNYLNSKTPVWFVEGTAEYYTEKWRPYRSDLSHKYHVLKNKLDEMDPHHDGYSKVLYLSDKFGDSTITKIINDRNKIKLFRFGKSFKKYTGISLDQFEEDWRRHMNTYYYGYRAQKEPIEEIGTTTTLPVKEQFGFTIAPDSLQMIIVGRNDKDQRDMSLYLALRDTSSKKSKRDGIFAKLFNKQEPEKEEKSQLIKWDLKEINYGTYHRKLSWSPNNKQIVYSKYHFGENQSMIWDLRTYDLETQKHKWITDSFRATWPDWSPDGKQIVLVAHKNSISNLYLINPDGSGLNQLTNYKDDIQIISPSWSPDGSQIAFGKANTDGNMDIYLLDINSFTERRLTDNISAEYLPVWHPDGKAISFTSHSGGTPNIHTIKLESGEIKQVTDVGDAIFSWQWTPNDTTLTALTLADVDSVRIVQINPNRNITTDSLSLRDTYTKWRIAHSEFVLPISNPLKEVKFVEIGKYRFYKHPHHFMSLAAPYFDGSGAFGLTVWTDAMGKHMLQAGVGVSWSDESDPWLLLNYINAEHGPLWQLNYFYNTQWRIRPYDRSLSGLIEKFDGIQFASQIPFNFHNSLSSNHMLRMSLSLQKRSVYIPSDEYDYKIDEFVPRNPNEFHDLPIPEEGKEGIVSLNYRWLNRRPNIKNSSLPNQGFGLQGSIDFANNNIFGDFSYTHLKVSCFSNLKLLGPITLFSRIKSQSMFGEVHNPRGWDNVRLGNRLVFGSLELRVPLIQELPINILGFSVGSVTGAIISDFGNVWNAGGKLQDWIFTAGYEIKFAIKAGRIPLINFAWGEAQTAEDWKDQENPQQYFRLALVNPF
jgi:Tol biopolymer transport system component